MPPKKIVKKIVRKKIVTSSGRSKPSATIVNETMLKPIREYWEQLT